MNKIAINKVDRIAEKIELINKLNLPQKAVEIIYEEYKAELKWILKNKIDYNNGSEKNLLLIGRIYFLLNSLKISNED